MDHMLLVPACGTHRETHHRRRHCEYHSHITPEMQLAESLIRHLFSPSRPRFVDGNLDYWPHHMLTNHHCFSRTPTPQAGLPGIQYYRRS
jgi:hypothetical protein